MQLQMKSPLLGAVVHCELTGHDTLLAFYHWGNPILKNVLYTLDKLHLSLFVCFKLTLACYHTHNGNANQLLESRHNVNLVHQCFLLG